MTICCLLHWQQEQEWNNETSKQGEWTVDESARGWIFLHDENIRPSFSLIENSAGI